MYKLVTACACDLQPFGKVGLHRTLPYIYIIYMPGDLIVVVYVSPLVRDTLLILIKWHPALSPLHPNTLEIVTQLPLGLCADQAGGTEKCAPNSCQALGSRTGLRQ